MKIGFIGLGRMGNAMVLNAIESGHSIVGYDRNHESVKALEKEGMHPAFSIEELIKKLSDQKQKVIWLMITAGKPVDAVIAEVAPLLSEGDSIIDGGNSWYEDSQRRAKELGKRGIHFVDCGTSGGVDGARHGTCMLLGGSKEAVKTVAPFVHDLCVRDGYAHVGASGAGHFVKMVHNGIEYGMMAALGEGFGALQKHEKAFGLDLKEIAKAYAHGSVIESKLASWVQSGMNRADFKDIKGIVPQGETEHEMEKLEKISDMPILKEARMQRIKSRKKPSFSSKIVATLRNEFGGHKIKKK
ncbi:MAG: phosphogluconate dehydrogenase (NAD(+)-dependent, decarboxylating) [Nanoarchaeota archaeon]